MVCFPLAMSVWHLVKRFIKNWSEGITPLLASFGYYVTDGYEFRYFSSGHALTLIASWDGPFRVTPGRAGA